MRSLGRQRRFEERERISSSADAARKRALAHAKFLGVDPPERILRPDKDKDLMRQRAFVVMKLAMEGFWVQAISKGLGFKSHASTSQILRGMR